MLSSPQQSRSARIRLSTSLLALTIAAPAIAQTDAETIPENGSLSEIVVTGELIRGQVETDIKPISELQGEDVQAYGVSSVDELLTALGPEVGSGRGRGGGRPVVLLNGRRVSGFRELRDLPADAVARVQIFPEELALQYGYRPDQRVVNIILKDNYDSLAAEFEYGGSTAGGRAFGEAELTFTRIGENTRLNVDVEMERSGMLTESERGIEREAGAFPYSRTGTISALDGVSEIDPALSALAGQNVTSVEVPQGGVAGLGDLVTGANGGTGESDSVFRSLQPFTNRNELNITWSRRLNPTTDLTINGQYQLQEQRALLGLGSASLVVPASSPFSPFATNVRINRYFGELGALERETTSQDAGLSASLTGRLDAWNWTLTSDYTRSDSKSRTQRRLGLDALQNGITAGTIDAFSDDFTGLVGILPANVRHTITDSVNADALLSGPLIRLPAGTAQLSIGAGYDGSWLDSRSVASAVVTRSNLSREGANVTANIDIPILDGDAGLGAKIGGFSINANAGAQDLSDFGSLSSHGAGFRWEPFDNLEFTASYIAEEAAPAISDLGAAVELTPGVTVYDYLNGQSVAVDRITGGNPLLPAESRKDIKLALNWRTPFIEDLSLQVEYFRNRSEDVTVSFPTLNADIESAFADRITRDAAGNLLSIDARPVSYEEVRSDRLRFGFDYRGRFGGNDQERGGRGGRGEGGGREGGPRDDPAAGVTRMLQRRGGDGGRWFMGFGYILRLREDVLIRDGLTRLDLLDGDATSDNGGVSRHEAELSGGLFWNGMGARIEANYQSGTRVDGDPAIGVDTLRFSDLATVNLRLFARLDSREKWVEAAPFLKGTRIRLSVDNLFNSIRDVRDENGETPLAYQRGYLDPVGRTVEISFRKTF